MNWNISIPQPPRSGLASPEAPQRVRASRQHRAHLRAVTSPSQGAPSGRTDGEPARAIVMASDLPEGAVAAAALKHLGFEVIGLPHRPDLFDAKRMSALLRSQRIDLLVPTHAEDVLAVAAARSLLEADGTAVIAPAAEPAALLSDRMAMLGRLHGHGVAVPSFSLPSGAGDITGIRLLGGTAVASPRSPADASESITLRGPDDPRLAQIDDSWLLQRSVEGASLTVLLHRSAEGCERRGQATVRLLPSPELRLLRFESGAAQQQALPEATVRIEHETAEAAAHGAVQALGMMGPAAVDVVATLSGEVLVTDVRPCFGPQLLHAPELMDLAVPPRLLSRGSAHEQPQRRVL